MPPERGLPGSPADWLARARSDLALSRIPPPEGVLWEDLCFHAQQAAEKAIKAVYRAHGRAFRYTHDIAELLDGLRREGVEVPARLGEAAELTPFAWQARYPGTGEPPDEAEHRRALLLAEAVLRWAEAEAEGPRPRPG